MSAIEEWAKREALFRRAKEAANDRGLYADAPAFSDGAIWTAEQLQREDVKAAGIASLDAFNKNIDYYGFDAEAAQQACLAAMLAKIAEGAAS